jgi:hypothetical protein
MGQLHRLTFFETPPVLEDGFIDKVKTKAILREYFDKEVHKTPVMAYFMDLLPLKKSIKLL